MTVTKNSTMRADRDKLAVDWASEKAAFGIQSRQPAHRGFGQ
jgi:hypothetical protein